MEAKQQFRPGAVVMFVRVHPAVADRSVCRRALIGRLVGTLDQRQDAGLGPFWTLREGPVSCPRSQHCHFMGFFECELVVLPGPDDVRAFDAGQYEPVSHDGAAL